jgi:hypothetical protein
VKCLTCATASPANGWNYPIAVGERIDEEIRQEITENRKPDKPAKQMIIGIDGAFVKGLPPTDRANLEIITGRIESDAEPSKVFVVVPNETFRRCYGNI